MVLDRDPAARHIFQRGGSQPNVDGFIEQILNEVVVEVHAGEDTDEVADLCRVDQILLHRVLKVEIDGGAGCLGAIAHGVGKDACRLHQDVEIGGTVIEVVLVSREHHPGIDGGGAFCIGSPGQSHAGCGAWSHLHTGSRGQFDICGSGHLEEFYFIGALRLSAPVEHARGVGGGLSQ